jgi:hypothetical protein
VSRDAIRDALLPELQPYYGNNGLLHHRLIVDTVWNCDEAARANERYQHKKQQQRELLPNPGDGQSYVRLHERPYRFQALQQINRRVTDADYWRLVREVWIDSENIRQNFAGWQRLWSAPRPCKEECMIPEERDALASKPASFPIWRGLGFRGRPQGLSWTIDRDKAVWFAQRFGGGRAGRLVHAQVERSHVHAFFQGRKESEIVASAVRILRIEQCPP